MPPYLRKIVRFTPIAPVLYTVVAGAAGWIDTDVSATTGLDMSKVWLVACANGTAANLGVRALGSSIDSMVPINNILLVTRVGGTGHVELRREAGGDNAYRFIGYLE